MTLGCQDPDHSGCPRCTARPTGQGYNYWRITGLYALVSAVLLLVLVLSGCEPEEPRTWFYSRDCVINQDGETREIQRETSCAIWSSMNPMKPRVCMAHFHKTVKQYHGILQCQREVWNDSVYSDGR